MKCGFLPNVCLDGTLLRFAFLFLDLKSSHRCLYLPNFSSGTKHYEFKFTLQILLIHKQVRCVSLNLFFPSEPDQAFSRADWPFYTAGLSNGMTYIPVFSFPLLSSSVFLEAAHKSLGMAQVEKQKAERLPGYRETQVLPSHLPKIYCFQGIWSLQDRLWAPVVCPASCLTFGHKEPWPGVLMIWKGRQINKNTIKS